MKKILLSFILIILCFSFFLYFQKPKSYKEKIQFASWGSKTEVEILKPVLKEFEKEYPEYEVEFIHIPENYFQKLHLLFASNLAPDVVFMNNLYLPFFANAGMLEELHGNFANYFEKKALKALSFKQKLYGIPRDISTIVVYVNEDLFKEYGVSLPKKNWSFDNFLNKAIALSQDTNFDGKTDIWGVGFEEAPPLYYLSFLMSEGGGILSDDTTQNILDTEESQRGLLFYSNLRNKYHVAPTKAEAASVTMSQLFLQGKLAMQITGRWVVPKYLQDADFKWNVYLFPSGSNGSVTPLDASGWCITKQSQHKSGAKKLIAFLSNHENIVKFTESGLIVPARTDVMNCEFLNFNADKLNNEVFKQSIKTAKTTPVSVDYNEIQDNVTKITNYLFNK